MRKVGRHWCQEMAEGIIRRANNKKSPTP